ncbi:dihydrofolate reductase family protein [Nocardioides sp.]|uniref:dihydrofolate reductase family protein n=1 Tax=Nocardioides sp. TaxID=35761 RepID=UPI002BEFC867|nr:dihydrofolate reductase family protein [Nocardioides sp.]HXH77230.1 dihydrofolate reductase family protein [Nocardioides sp.]
MTTPLELHRLADLDEDALQALYEPPRTPWLRVNFVSTLDGASQGVDGLSKGINNAADKRVFHALRRRADVLVVGAGTLRAEGYAPPTLPLAIVSRSGDVPPTLVGSEQVHLVTCSSSPGLAAARSLLGRDRVFVLGDDAVELVAMKTVLAERGWVDQLSEGGPALFGSMLQSGIVDELCLTTVPRLVAGTAIRIAGGVDVDVRLRPGVLLEQDGTLLGRWLVD